MFAENLRAYGGIQKKTACIHNCEAKNRIQEEKEGKMIGQDKNYFNQTLNGKPASKYDTITYRTESNLRTLCTQPCIKNKEPPQQSCQFYYEEKLFMAWGVPQKNE